MRARRTRIDVTASSVGDARSLQGGVLLPTPLRGPNGQSHRDRAGSALDRRLWRRHRRQQRPGQSSDGRPRAERCARARRRRDRSAARPTRLRCRCKDPDFITADRIAQAINRELGDGFGARARFCDGLAFGCRRIIASTVPELMARIEPLSVDVDAVARVVINERTGTVVVGGSRPPRPGRGSARQSVGEDLDASWRCRSRRRFRKTAPRWSCLNEQVDVKEGRNQLLMLEQGTTLESVVRGLNALGASPRDIIAIMQALKAAGALRAELVIL